MDEGECEALHPMWYHNKKSGTFQKFFYGGCGGNDNTFRTRRKCEKTCKVTSSGHVPSELKWTPKWTRGNVSREHSFLNKIYDKHFFGFRLELRKDASRQ